MVNTLVPRMPSVPVAPIPLLTNKVRDLDLECRGDVNQIDVILIYINFQLPLPSLNMAPQSP